MAESEPDGKIKILINRKKRIIGTQIAGIHAGELIIPSILALRNRYKLMSIMSPIFPYPVLSEIHKKAALDFYSAKIFNDRVRGILKKVFHYRGKN
jgi:pyruvate/2-oxoglutarate dehydrogenase complex dihydrolipoamide dehydrogenase (E3) component